MGLKAAVIGTGFIGPVHVEALRRVPVEVVGILGSSAERTRPKAEALGIERVYDSLEELLCDRSIDVVHITSPNHLHFSQAKAALGAGKHVVCEKPLAMNSTESGELVTVARDSGLIAAVNFNIRYYPLVHEARSRVQSGQLGDLFTVQGSYLQDWLLYPTDWNWRLEPEYSGPMRAVADIGSHWLDLVHFVTGLKVEAVFADFQTVHPSRRKPKGAVETFTGKPCTEAETVDQPIGTEDIASILLRFEGGGRGVVTASQVNAGRKNRLFVEIGGSKEALAWDSEMPNQLWIGHRDRPNELLLKDPSLLSPCASAIASYPGGHNEGFPDTFKQLYRDVYHVIQNPAADPKFPTFEDGHREMLVGEAIYRSAQEERWVAIE